MTDRPPLSELEPDPEKLDANKELLWRLARTCASIYQDTSLNYYKRDLGSALASLLLVVHDCAKADKS